MHQNAVFRICSFKIFPGMTTDPRCGRGDPLTHPASARRGPAPPLLWPTRHTSPRGLYPPCLLSIWDLPLPLWHVSSCSGVATLRTAIHLLPTYLLTYLLLWTIICSYCGKCLHPSSRINCARDIYCRNANHGSLTVLPEWHLDRKVKQFMRIKL